MKNIFFYLLQMIIASGMLYGYYHFFLRNKKFHRYNRFYLLLAVAISIVIPFVNIPVYFSKETTDSSLLLQTLNVIASSDFEQSLSPVLIQEIRQAVNILTWQNSIYAIYLLIALIFLVRIILSIRRIRIISSNYPSEKIGDIHFINTNEPGTPFSFFRSLFWNKNIELHSEKGEQIFRHEYFHINQRHSADIVFIEFIASLGWFNPFFHLIKKELKAIHEFLADEYAMNKNESWKYAELLLMQVLNTNNNLVNPFFHNQIKRRIAMITSSQKPGHQYLRKLLVLPVAAVIAVLFAFSYQNKKAEENPVIGSKNQITIVVDAGHGGTDIGAKSLDGLTSEAELTLEISKTIQQLAPEYNINVVMTRENEEFPGSAANKKDGLRKRVEISNSVMPSAFISIHVNVAGRPGIPTELTGFDAYISGQPDKLIDNLLASSIIKEISNFYAVSPHVKTRSNKGLFVLDSNIAPSVILECGYITNPKDLIFISDKSNQEKIARAILSSISKFANRKDISVTEGIISDTPKTKYPDTLSWNRNSGGYPVFNMTNFKAPAKKSPTTEQLKKWSDAKTYGVWIDVNRINNTDLVKYKPTDFVLFIESKLAKNAINYGKHFYQVSLYTPKYYAKSFSKFTLPILKDTTSLLVVIDGKIIGRMTTSELNKMYSSNNSIESINVLKNAPAIAKYGNEGKNGVIEITIKKKITDPYIRKTEVELLDTGTTIENLVFEKVEIEPAFPGGNEGWKNFLKVNLNSLVPVDSGAKAGTYKTQVRFIVDIKGNTGSFHALTKNGFGMEDEVIRAISNGPKWIPALQNGKVVTVYMTQSVTFVVTEDVADDVKASQVSITSDRLNNELFLGVINPITISMAGIRSEDLKVNISQGSIFRRSDGKYYATVNFAGEAIITVSSNNRTLPAEMVRFKTSPLLAY